MDFKPLPHKPAKWWFQPSVCVQRNDDGTFNVTIEWRDCASGEEYTETFDGSECWDTEAYAVGAKLLDEFVLERFGAFDYEMAAKYLPAQWEEPMNETERQEHELAQMKAELAADLESLS
jgi:hypothetical protein